MYLQPLESESETCVGWGPLKLHVYVISSPSTMVDGLMLRVAAHGEGGGDGGGHVPETQLEPYSESKADSPTQAQRMSSLFATDNADVPCRVTSSHMRRVTKGARREGVGCGCGCGWVGGGGRGGQRARRNVHWSWSTACARRGMRTSKVLDMPE